MGKKDEFNVVNAIMSSSRYLSLSMLSLVLPSIQGCFQLKLMLSAKLLLNSELTGLLVSTVFPALRDLDVNTALWEQPRGWLFFRSFGANQ